MPRKRGWSPGLAGISFTPSARTTSCMKPPISSIRHLCFPYSSNADNSTKICPTPFNDAALTCRSPQCTDRQNLHWAKVSREWRAINTSLHTSFQKSERTTSHRLFGTPAPTRKHHTPDACFTRSPRYNLRAICQAMTPPLSRLHSYGQAHHVMRRVRVMLDTFMV